MSETYQGRCFCGAVELEARGTPLEMGFCHCASCRAWSGAPVTAFSLWKAEQVAVTRGEEHLAGFNRMGISDRRFCTACGGHVFVGHPGLGLTDVPAALFPALPFAPELHLNYGEAVLPMKDGLPKLKDFPAHAGGSGETMPE